MIRRRLPWILPALFLSWVGVSLIVLAEFGDRLPVVITNFLSVALVPFLLALPILSTLGLSSGEYWTLPSILGFVLVGGVYAIVLYGLGSLFSSRGRDVKR